MFRVTPEMIKTYLENRSSDIEALSRSVKEKSIDEFHRIGHQLSGNARNFGFEDLESIAQKMENLLPSEFDRKAKALLTELKLWLRERTDGSPH